MRTADVIHGTVSVSGRMDKALAEATNLSRERIKALIAQGAITVGKTTISSPSAKVQAGAGFVITLPAPTPAEAQPEDIPLDVVFEDGHLIVVNKPAGMVVHPAAGNYTGTLVNALLYHCKGQLSGIGGVARPGIVHRIDKDTSGLLVAAKTTAAHEGLASQFADHSISRRYLAVASGYPIPPAATIDARIGRSDRNRKKMAVLDESSARGKHAITHYKTLKRLENSSLIECRLETGRTHQIRVHMSSIGHPLVGDQMYGRNQSALKPILDRIGFHRQALHAADLGFDHPVFGNRIELSAELPADMQELIDQTDGLNR
ncbi:RluA family pseudouridine synthase [Altererythrobacter aquiaggeris]|uniref:RluA family pseudouridine synthase n=1 Tax=Aestuarierythrobacter aquiaggeris TaxID=1898396 RepID=UPI0030161215